MNSSSTMSQGNLKSPLLQEVLNILITPIEISTDLSTQRSNDNDSFVKIAFNQFLDERRRAKRLIYLKVSLIGMVMALTCFMLVCFLSTVAPQYGQNYNTWYDICISLFTFFRVVGICTFSTVPTDEVDIIEIMLRKRHHLIWFSVAIGTILILTALNAVIYLCVPWAATQSRLSGLVLVGLMILIAYPAIVVGFWHFLSLRGGLTYQQLHVKAKYSLLLICYEIFVYSTMCVAFHFSPFNPGVRYDSNLRGLYNSGWPYALVIIYQWIIDNAVFINRHLGYKEKECLITPVNVSEKGGHGVKALYMLIYRICAAVALTFWVQAIESFTTLPLTDPKAWVELGSGWADVLPILSAFYFGHQHCFTLLARYFEYDVGRQRLDGFFMVILVKMCQELPEDASGSKIR